MTLSVPSPGGNSTRRRGGLRQWLGLERNIIVLLLVLLALGLGEELWARFVPRYLEFLGGGVWVVAAYGTLKDVLDALLPYPGGWLTDRLGRRRALAAFAALTAAGYLIYLLSPTWPWFLVGTLLAVAWSSLGLPALFAVIGDSLPREKRGVGFSVQSLWKRLPIIFAPPLGGWLIVALGMNAGMKWGFAASSVLAVLAVLIVLRFYVEPAAPGAKPQRIGEIWRGLDRRLRRLLLADVLARWAEGIPKVYIVLYVLDVLHREPTEFGWLVGLQMFVATVSYLPTARLADRMERKPIVLATFVMFAAFPLVLVRAAGLPGLIAAFIVAGLREVGEPARKALIVDLAPPDARGRTVGLYYLLRSLTVLPAALVGGWLWSLRPDWPFYAACVIGAFGVGAYAAWGPSGSVDPVPTAPER